MVAKTRTASRRRRPQEPLEMRVSLRFIFGDGPGENLRMIDDRRVPLVGSVFENRDRILRSFAVLMLRAGMLQPKVITELFPAFRVFSRLRPSGR